MSAPKIKGLTIGELRVTFRYDPESGEFTRLTSKARAKIGDRPERVRAGRSVIAIAGDRFFAHHLAWFYMTGEWPTDTIDHIDRDPLNNKWDNLRMATLSEQGMNRGQLRPHVLTGAYQLKSRKLWRSYIKVNRKERHLGYFKTEQAAHAAYLKAKAEMHVINTYPKEAA